MVLSEGNMDLVEKRAQLATQLQKLTVSLQQLDQLLKNTAREKHKVESQIQLLDELMAPKPEHPEA